ACCPGGDRRTRSARSCTARPPRRRGRSPPSAGPASCTAAAHGLSTRCPTLPGRARAAAPVLAVELVVSPDQGGDRGSLAAVQAAGRVLDQGQQVARRGEGHHGRVPYRAEPGPPVSEDDHPA